MDSGLLGWLGSRTDGAAFVPVNVFSMCNCVILKCYINAVSDRSCLGEFHAKCPNLCWTTVKFRRWKSPPWWHALVSTTVDTSSLPDFLQKRFHVTFLQKLIGYFADTDLVWNGPICCQLRIFRLFFPLPLIFQDPFLQSWCWSSVSRWACLGLTSDTWELVSFSLLLTELPYFLPSSYLPQLQISKCFTKETKILSPILQIPGATRAEWLVPDHPARRLMLVAGGGTQTCSSQALIPVLSSLWTLLPTFNGLKIPVLTAQALLWHLQKEVGCTEVVLGRWKESVTNERSPC